MTVKDLIASAKKNPEILSLPTEALDDLREVLRANAKETNHKRRVSAAAFATYVRQTYKISISEKTVKAICERDLKRPWLVR